MAMTPEQVRLVRTSFAEVLPISAQAASVFYGRLFELAPGMRTLFKGDMAEQGRKLMAMLRTLVETLDQPEVLLPAARALAVRHVAYGARPEHYSVVGKALLETLAVGLGPSFDAAMRAAWEAAYGTLACAMIVAGEQASAAAK